MNFERSNQMKMNSHVEQCYDRSNDNPERFANCMVGAQKKINEQQEMFSMSLIFMTKNVNECLKKTKGDTNEC